MLERLAVGIRNDEAAVTFRLGPVERKRDLVGPLLHLCHSPVWLVVGCGCGCAGGAGAATGGGGSAGGLLDDERSFTTVPDVSTIQPRADKAAASWLMSPWYFTRM